MGKLTFIVGGARSGKSHYASRLASRRAAPVVYIATGEAKDREMAERIAHHRRTRPARWTTYEEPKNIARLIDTLPRRNTTVVVDCLTLLVTNLMLAGHADAAIEKQIATALAKLRKRNGQAILVSNEVGLGIVPANRMARAFRDIAGTVNKLVAARADRVIFMVSGIPWRVK